MVNQFCFIVTQTCQPHQNTNNDITTQRSAHTPHDRKHENVGTNRQPDDTWGFRDDFLLSATKWSCNPLGTGGLLLNCERSSQQDNSYPT